jgi:hypothetical protein
MACVRYRFHALFLRHARLFESGDDSCAGNIASICKAIRSLELLRPHWQIPGRAHRAERACPHGGFTVRMMQHIACDMRVVPIGMCSPTPRRQTFGRWGCFSTSWSRFVCLSSVSRAGHSVCYLHSEPPFSPFSVTDCSFPLCRRFLRLPPPLPPAAAWQQRQIGSLPSNVTCLPATCDLVLHPRHGM